MAGETQLVTHDTFWSGLVSLLLSAPIEIFDVSRKRDITMLVLICLMGQSAAFTASARLIASPILK